MVHLCDVEQPQRPAPRSRHPRRRLPPGRRDSRAARPVRNLVAKSPCGRCSAKLQAGKSRMAVKQSLRGVEYAIPAHIRLRFSLQVEYPRTLPIRFSFLCPPIRNNSSTWTTTPRRASIRASSRRCCPTSTRSTATRTASTPSATKRATPSTPRDNRSPRRSAPTPRKSSSPAAPPRATTSPSAASPSASAAAAIIWSASRPSTRPCSIRSRDSRAAATT